MAYLGNSPFQLSQLPSATIPFTGSQFAVNLVPNTVSALDLGSSSNPWRNVYGNVVGTVTNVAGGAANRILYQTAANTTTFVAAPTVTDTYLKWNSGTGFSWSAVTGGVTGSSTANQTSVGSIYEMNASATYSVVIGSSARAAYGAYNSTVIGHNARTGVNNCNDSVLIGKDAYTINPFAVAIGSASNAGGAGSTAICYGANAGYSTGGTVIGFGSSSSNSHEFGIAIGYNAYSTGGSSIALGYQCNSTGYRSIAIGDSAYASTARSIVIGTGNDNGNNSIILNALGPTLGSSSDGFYVKPIASGTTSNALYYDINSGQITYGTGGGGASLIVKYNGSTLTSAATSIDFTGAGLTVTNTGGAITVNVAASAGGSSGTPTVTTTKITPTNIMDSGSNYIDIQFSSPSIATYVRETLQALSTIAMQYSYNISSFMATQPPEAFANLQLTSSSQANFQMVGSATVRGQSSQWGWYNFTTSNPSAQKYIGFTLDSSVVMAMNLLQPNVVAIVFSNPAVATQIATRFATNKPSSFTAYRGYVPSNGSNGYYSCVENSITSVEVQSDSLIITSSQDMTIGVGGPSSQMLGLTLGITTTSSGGGSSSAPLTNGWAVSSINANNPNGLEIEFMSPSDRTAYINSITAAETILQTFAQNAGTYAQISFYATDNNNVYMLPPPYSPTVMKPIVTAGPTSTQLIADTSSGLNSVPLSQFPQWSDNTNRIWNSFFFGGGQWSQMQYNPQYNSPTIARVSPSMPNGIDVTNTTMTAIQNLLSANLGVQNVVIQIFGYNSAMGVTDRTTFFGCSQITYNGYDLQFTYTTSTNSSGGYGGYYIRMFVDIQ